MSPQAFRDHGWIVAAHNLKERVQALCAIYLDAPDSRQAGELRSHAAVIVRPDFSAAVDGLEYSEVECGKYAIMQHHDPTRCSQRLRLAVRTMVTAFGRGTARPASDGRLRQRPSLGSTLK